MKNSSIFFKNCWTLKANLIWMVKVKGTSFEFIWDMYDVDDHNRVQVWKLITKWFKSYHIHRESHIHLNFHNKFDLEGQG